MILATMKHASALRLGLYTAASFTHIVFNLAERGKSCTSVYASIIYIIYIDSKEKSNYIIITAAASTPISL